MAVKDMIILIFFLNCLHCLVSATNKTKSITDIKPQNYIHNGELASKGEFPYIVGLACNGPINDKTLVSKMIKYNN